MEEPRENLPRCLRIEYIAALRNGRGVEYLQQHQTILDRKWLRMLAARWKSLECLHCLDSEDRGAESVIEASRVGFFEGLQDLHKRGYPWHENVCFEAARSGQIQCLQYAHENGCPWSISTLAAASRKGHLECVKYCLENNAPIGPTCLHEAAIQGRIECWNLLKEVCSHSDVDLERCLLKSDLSVPLPPKWHLKQRLGAGSTAVVYLIGQDEDFGADSLPKVLALKVYRRAVHAPVAMHELSYLQYLDGSGLAPKAYHMWMLGTQPALLIEPFDGTLEYLLAYATSSQRQILIRQTYTLIKNLNNLGICHQDLSIVNILYRKDGEKTILVLADFARAKSDQNW